MGSALVVALILGLFFAPAQCPGADSVEPTQTSTAAPADDDVAGPRPLHEWIGILYEVLRERKVQVDYLGVEHAGQGLAKVTIASPSQYWKLTPAFVLGTGPVDMRRFGKRSRRTTFSVRASVPTVSASAIAAGLSRHHETARRFYDQARSLGLLVDSFFVDQPTVFDLPAGRGPALRLPLSVSFRGPEAMAILKGIDGFLGKHGDVFPDALQISALGGDVRLTLRATLFAAPLAPAPKLPTTSQSLRARVAARLSTSGLTIEQLDVSTTAGEPPRVEFRTTAQPGADLTSIVVALLQTAGVRDWDHVGWSSQQEPSRVSGTMFF